MDDRIVYPETLFDKKWNTEINNYTSIYYGLRHKVIEVGYFFKDQDPVVNCRKLVVTNPTECISTVQVRLVNNSVPIGSSFHISSYMRSSDICGLLPIDMLGLMTIGQNFVNEFLYNELGKPKIDYSMLSLFISSAHIYI